MSKYIDPVDLLRKAIGIQDEGPTHAGVGNDPTLTPEEQAAEVWRQKQLAYQMEMEFLQNGGSNASGNEQWQRLMRGVGRG